MEILYMNLKNGNLVNKSKKWAVILEEWQKLGLQCQKKIPSFCLPQGHVHKTLCLVFYGVWAKMSLFKTSCCFIG